LKNKAINQLTKTIYNKLNHGSRVHRRKFQGKSS
jgi:hypothetical protein